ncbi:Oligopeptide transporter OPT superfamily [Cordyceps militaris CM01]|uniref:Oligopeptide transporter OPT superfamily n=1 Tax=Cordyceps militaris (strain CM01) TaxID=983644 RepID=G3JER4_CORMM|nr:Oligopeptide transporter OPT superfamily [Cordyceps militaris CM01]EGX93023.1 Oligopeptide transporter OPT superfamily [Cordyceps militaris CM01]
MARSVNEPREITSQDANNGGVLGEKRDVMTEVHYDDELERTQTFEGHLNATEDDILEAKEVAASMSLETVQKMMRNVILIHDGDPNFPFVTLQKIKEFLGMLPIPPPVPTYQLFTHPPQTAKEDIADNSEKHERLIQEMKLEAALITNNSPYAEVRAVVDNHDDATLPVSTIRAWTIGILFSVFLAFVNQLFSIRYPSIRFDTNVAQLLAYPLGKAWERWMPRADIRLPFGRGLTIPLNPGRFNKKEHMLIAIMANTSRSVPYTAYIVWVQVLPQYFNQAYARSFGYMFCNAFATNFIGYGLAGLTRKFLVYPSYCVWPSSLVTISLNSALHNEENHSVLGPFKKMWNISRYNFFLATFAAMFVYFWFPNYIFSVLSYFSWMTWIAPDNLHLEIWTGMKNGLGLFNPVPTFDWNIICFTTDPLMIPSFATFNAVGGMFITGFLIAAVWYTNTWNTGYLPIVSNRLYDHHGKLYNVSRTLDAHGMYDEAKYKAYSAAYMTAGNSLVYGFFFAVYAAIVTHVILYHRYELVMGFKNLWHGLKWTKKKGSAASTAATVDGAADDTIRANEGQYQDVHNRLMAAYPEVSEWWYFGVLVISIVFGIVGISVWPTYTSVGVVFYGILLCLIFVIPVGIVAAMTGIEVTLNVLAEFIGGMIVEGNALAMNFFKSYGYVTCAHAVSFATDLKIAHYVKIPPRITFAGQLVATLISTLVCTGVLKFQIELKNVCQENAPMRFLCPGPNTFFTASVLWGTIGPIKVFGKDGQYRWLLLGFPIGILLVLACWGLKRAMPNNRALRQIHIVAAIAGSLHWTPYSFSFAWGAVPVAWFSWIYIRSRYLAFWSKYNFVLSASLSAAIAISAIVMIFSVQWAEKEIEWWGNSQASVGCEKKACTLHHLAQGERFYPWWDSSKIPAP